MIEVRFHGRGGQGAVTAAELLAVAVGDGGKYSQAFPFFGVERRGAPVRSFCRIDDKPITLHQEVYEPDVIVVLDETLLKDVNVYDGMRKGGAVIINGKTKGCLEGKVYLVDATGIALKHMGKPIVNTAMLGAFAKVTGLVSLDALKQAIREHFPPELAEKNIKAITECYENTKGNNALSDARHETLPFVNTKG